MIAGRRGADLLAFPAPLAMGVAPGALTESANFQHDLLASLEDLSGSLGSDAPVCLVPAIIPLGDGSLFEVLMLRDGHVSPLRLAFFRYKEGSPFDLWSPPIIDVDDARIAVTFDVFRDISEVPTGCDLVLSFQVPGFNVLNAATHGAAAFKTAGFDGLARDNRLWLAHLVPVGGFDEAVYTGGSFVIDEEGALAAAAPHFEEALLVHEISRGVPALASEPAPPTPYDREEWIWQALRTHLRDTVIAEGTSRVALHLDDDLPSALLAALAVDALGPRNVLAVHMGREGASTPAESAQEAARAARVREVAASLGVRLIERSIEGTSGAADRDTPARPRSRQRLAAGVEALCLDEAAFELGAFPLSPLTKTHYALAGGAGAFAGFGMLAPFGDVYLTELEFLARRRNRLSPVLPPRLVGLEAVREEMRRVVCRAVTGSYRDPSHAERVERLLRGLEPSEIDGVLEAHVDRNLPLEDIPCAREGAAPIAMLLLLVRRGEAVRRRLPAHPVISARSFDERAWPAQLGWSDLGRHGREPMDAESLASASIARFRERTEGEAERMRREILGLIGGMMGLSPEQMDGISSDGSPERIERELERLQGRLRDAAEGKGTMDGREPSEGALGGILGTAGTYPFFSRN